MQNPYNFPVFRFELFQVKQQIFPWFTNKKFFQLPKNCPEKWFKVLRVYFIKFRCKYALKK